MVNIMLLTCRALEADQIPARNDEFIRLPMSIKYVN